MDLYVFLAGTTSRAVLALCEKEQLDVTVKNVDITKGEQHQAPFCTLNPNRMVPLLVDDDVVLSEAAAILRYLAAKADSEMYPRLHANCAHCHNPTGSARPDTDMNLRLSVRDSSLAATATYQTTVGVELQFFDDAPLETRVVAGAPDESGLLYRMLERGPDTQMPPLASEIVDDRGTALVRGWIESL